jgi:MFS family permease
MSQSTSSWSALRYREFRWMFMAQFVSLIGASMQLAAINWHVWELTHDELALGGVALVRIVPIIILSLIGGVVADALDRRKLILRTQTAMLTFALLLSLATLSGHATLPLIYLMTALLGGLVAFDQPARAALIPKLVPEAEIAHASRINTLLWEFASVIAPLFAGLVLASGGPGLAYAANALSIVPMLAVIWMLRHLPLKLEGEKREISFAAMREGLNFVRSTPLLWSTMLLDFFATFFGSALALLPVYATDILNVGAEGYGVLAAAPAFGATLGAVVMAQLGNRVREQGKIMLWAVAAYGAATVVFGLSTNFALSFVALAGVGLFDAISTVIRGALRQIITPDRLRGRMLSVNMIFVMGGPQLGDFEAGMVARLTSTPISVITGGASTLIAVAVMALVVPALRHYREHEIVAVAPAAAD